MKQISTTELVNIVKSTSKLPVNINGYIISGSLQNCELLHVRFTNCNLTNIFFTNCQIISCVFSQCQISHLGMHNTKIKHCIIKDSTMFNTLFSRSEMLASKITNASSSKMTWEHAQIKHSKVLFSSLIATTWKQSNIVDCIFEYSVFDASKFIENTIANSTFSAMSMRGVSISNCNITATLFDDINFDDALNKYQSEFFIPTKYTEIQNNSITGITITNTALKNTFHDFIPHSKTKPKKVIAAKKYKYESNESTKHLLPQSVKNYNISVIVTLLLQGFVTIGFIILFNLFQNSIVDIEYKQLQTFVAFPVSFFENSVEIHDFAFYCPFIFFLMSSLLFVISYSSLYKMQNIFIMLLYRFQAFTTFVVLLWVYWCNIVMKSNSLSIANLLFAFYFLVMITQSFGINKK